MKNQVKIVPNEMGAKIRISKNNAEYAHVLLKQEKAFIGTNGWVKKNTLHTLLHGRLEDLQEIGIASLDSLPGQIVVKESTTPFNEQNPDVDLKIAGKTGIICCIHGEPIYRKAFYDAACTMDDELVAHNNNDAIREANAEDKIVIPIAQTKEDDNQVDLEDSIAEVEAEENEKSMISHEELSDNISDDTDIIEEAEEVEELELEEDEVTFEL